MPERYHIRENGSRLASVPRMGAHRQRGRIGHAQVEAPTRYAAGKRVTYIKRYIEFLYTVCEQYLRFI